MAQANQHSDGETIMKRQFALVLGFWLLLIARPLLAQELGRHFVKLVDGIYLYAKDGQSNCAIIVTQEGVVLVDSGPNPPDSHIVLKAVQQLTTQPIRFLINTETHNDHTTGNFVFSPPAIVIGAQGATQGIKSYYDPKRNDKLIAQSAEMRDALRSFRLATPQVEFHDRIEAAFRAVKK
jgi:glyoxylase-like metal-dependent hydrolase (beta-lactamase superfamily II)